MSHKISDGVNFCPKCGTTAVKDTNRSVSISLPVSASDAKMSIEKFTGSLGSPIDVATLISAALVIIAPFFPALAVNRWLTTDYYSYISSDLSHLGAINLIFGLITIGTVTLKKTMVSFIISLVNVSYVLFLSIGILSELKNYNMCSLTFGYHLTLISSIALAICAFLKFRASRRHSTKEVQEYVVS